MPPIPMADSVAHAGARRRPDPVGARSEDLLSSGRRASCARSTASASTCMPAARSASSARAAAARASRRAPSCGIVDRPGPHRGGRDAARSPAHAQRTDLAALDARSAQRCARCAARRSRLIFQEPMASFSHYYTVGNQIIEAIRAAQRLRARPRRARARSSCCARSASRGRSGAIDAYPFQLSGGLRQRVDDRDGARLRAARS